MTEDKNPRSKFKKKIKTHIYHHVTKVSYKNEEYLPNVGDKHGIINTVHIKITG